MDGVSGGLAVASFSIQLVETVHKANKFLKEMRNASEEIRKLADRIEELECILVIIDGLIKRQNAMKNLDECNDILMRAVERCNSKVAALDSYTKTIEGFYKRRGRVNQARASVKTVMRKEELRQLTEDVEAARSMLREALGANTLYLQLHQIECMPIKPLEPLPVVQNGPIGHTSADKPLFSEFQAFMASRLALVKTKDREVWRYQSILGQLKLRKRTKVLNSSTDDPNRDGVDTIISQENRFSVILSIVRTVLELRSWGSYFQIPTSLSIYAVQHLPRRLCWPENIEAFKLALRDRKISPYIINQHGQNLLHRAVNYGNIELCSLLLHLGVDVNYYNDDGRKPIHSWISPPANQSLLLRTLLNGGCEIDLEDLDIILRENRLMSREAVDLVLLANDTSFRTYYESRGPSSLLRIAIAHFKVGDWQWNSGLRELLRYNKDAHRETVQRDSESWSGVPNFEWTHLDALFLSETCPFRAEYIAQQWLQLLADEGFDIVKYISEEKSIHESQDYLTCPIKPDARASIKSADLGLLHRSLIFQTDEKPSISWTWWIDPQSSGRLVRHEFRHMNLAHQLDISPFEEDPWKNTWPYDYPIWSSFHEPILSWTYSSTDVKFDPLDELYQESYDPWIQLRMKAAQRYARQAKKKYPDYVRELEEMASIPGSWHHLDLEKLCLDKRSDWIS